MSGDMWEDELGQLLSIPVDCVIDDVFEGSWCWLYDECELHYTKDNSDLRSGAFSFHLDDRCSPGEALQFAQVGNESMDHLVPGDGPLPDGEGQQARTVRFNPHVEVVEFVAYLNIDLFQVDDVISCPDGSGDCCPQDHFEEEADDMLPWVQSLDVEEAPQDVDDAEDDPYVILHGFEVLETNTMGSTVSDLEPMQVITFGVRGQALGRRDTWVTVAELPALRRVVWELWQDEVPQFSACWAFAVRPQPLKELGVAKAWVLLVEIDPGQATPPGHCAVLMMTCSNANWMVGRPTPKLVLEDTSSDALVPQHFWASYCRPLGMRYCSLILEGDVKSPFEPVHVRPGALSKLMLGDAPPAFDEVRHWFPDTELVVREARSLQQQGIEKFHMVVHTADVERRAFEVDISAFTTPTRLKKFMPKDIQRGRLLWLPLRVTHPSMGVWTGCFHFVLGADRPGPSRPVFVLICRATTAYHEQWSHGVWWIPFTASVLDLVQLTMPDLDEVECGNVLVTSNHMALASLDGIHAGGVVTLYSGNSMSSEGIEPPNDADESTLMQLASAMSSGRDLASSSAQHMVLQHGRATRRHLGDATDVSHRRTVYLLDHVRKQHVLYSWARPYRRLWQGELREVDILIQHPRPLDVVDVIVEFVDAHTHSVLQDPSVFRLVPPLTNWALTWSLRQAFHYEADWQVGLVRVNGQDWHAGMPSSIIFQDGDVLTVFLQDGSNVNDACVGTPTSTDDELTSQESTDVELQLVTIFQSGTTG